MAQRILFVGGGLDSVAIAGSVAELTSNGREGGGANAINSLQISTQSAANPTNHVTATALDPATLLPTSVTAGSDFWARCFYTNPSSSNNTAGQPVMEFIDSSGFPWLRVVTNAVSAAWRFAHNTGTGASPVWTNTASAGVSGVPASSQNLDVRVRVGVGGNHSVEVYFSNQLLMSDTFTNTNLTNIRSVRYFPTQAGSTVFICNIVLTEDIPTIGCSVVQTAATGAGTINQWTGAHTDINESILSDTTLLSTSTAGNRASFAYGDIPATATAPIRDVWLWTRAKNDGSSPVNIRAVCRRSAVNYFSGNFPNMGLGYAAQPARWENDPATSAAWTAANFNAAEFGVEAVA
jgi:hypothetical protein